MASTSDVCGDALPRQLSLGRRVLNQGSLVVGAHVAAQALSFARNAVLAHWLSRGDFGIAAAIVMLLQMVETLSDLGADRLIVQARDGEDPRLIATAHATLIARGLATATAILVMAYPLATFLAVPEAAWAFAAVALAPAVKAFMHLDARRAQRNLDNRPQLMIEVAPQLTAFLMVIPALMLLGGYASVVAVTAVQALLSLVISHAVAEQPYRVALDRAYLKRLLAFGWPIWASALPLVAVYQGDRLLVARMLGIEPLASYTAAFMLTMVPGLLAAKLGTSLLLPLLSAVRDDSQRFRERYALMVEAVMLISAAYLAGFIIIGPSALTLAFGAKYHGLDAVLAWLAAMWAMRMIQAVAGMALMARGMTRPFFSAGVVRAFGLLLAYAAISAGLGLEGAAAAGMVAELVTMLYLASCLDRMPLDGASGLGRLLVVRATLLVPVAAISFAALHLAGATDAAVAERAALYLALLSALALGSVLATPRLISHCSSALR